MSTTIIRHLIYRSSWYDADVTYSICCYLIPLLNLDCINLSSSFSNPCGETICNWFANSLQTAPPGPVTPGGADLSFSSPLTHISLQCKTTDTGLVHCLVRQTLSALPSHMASTKIITFIPIHIFNIKLCACVPVYVYVCLHLPAHMFGTRYL